MTGESDPPLGIAYPEEFEKPCAIPPSDLSRCTPGLVLHWSQAEVEVYMSTSLTGHLDPNLIQGCLLIHDCVEVFLSLALRLDL